MSQFQDILGTQLQGQTNPDLQQLYRMVSEAAMRELAPRWQPGGRPVIFRRSFCSVG